MIAGLKSIIKLTYFRIKYSSMGVKIDSKCKVSKRSTFEGSNHIGKNSFFDGHIGFGSYVGSNCNLNAKIGRYCSIADNVSIVVGAHPTSYVSTHPAFYSTRKQSGFSFVKNGKFEEIKYADNQKHIVTIGNDVWIGFGALLLQGINIGDGAVIGAGAIVTKDVEPYSIVAGVPAKLIRKRFSDEEIAILLDTKWWDKDFQWINDNVDLFTDPLSFCQKISGKGE